MSKKKYQINPTAEGLMYRRTIVLSGEIDRRSIAYISQRLMALQMQSSDWINLIIDSNGGNLEAALQLGDLITIILTAPVRGIALGNCGSAATFIMLQCQERISTPYSRFMIHSGISNQISIPINHTTSEYLEQLLAEMKSADEMIIRLYADRLTPLAWQESKPTDEERHAFVQQLIKRGDQRFDDWLSAEEAIQIGLVDKIQYEKLEIFSD